MTTKTFFKCNVCKRNIPDDNEGLGFMLEGSDDNGIIDKRELSVHSILDAGIHVCRRCSYWIGQHHNNKYVWKGVGGGPIK